MPEYKVDTLSEIESIVKASFSKVVVLYTAPSWCRPCQAFKPHWDRAVQEATDVVFVYVDIDKVPIGGIQSVPQAHLYENGEHTRDIKVPVGALPFLKDIRG